MASPTIRWTKGIGDGLSDGAACYVLFASEHIDLTHSANSTSRSLESSSVVTYPIRSECAPLDISAILTWLELDSAKSGTFMYSKMLVPICLSSKKPPSHVRTGREFRNRKGSVLLVLMKVRRSTVCDQGLSLGSEAHHL